jgi:hypothetical protein
MEKEEEEERNKVISLDAKPLQGSPCQSPLPAISDHFTQHLKWPLLVTHSRASLQGCFHPTWRLCVYDAVVEFFFLLPSSSSSSPQHTKVLRVLLLLDPIDGQGCESWGRPKKEDETTTRKITNIYRLKTFIFFSKMAAYVYLYDV